MTQEHGHPDATTILTELVDGQESAADRLMPFVYDELRALAARYLQQFPGAVTLQPTALVHEAYLRLIGQSGSNFHGRSHFMAVAAKVMRGILVDRARREAAQKHGGGWTRITLDQAASLSAQGDVDTLALDDVLQRLSQLDHRKARIAELRFFGGLSIDEVAEAIGIARSTVTEDWRMARAWLAKELEPES